MKSRDKFLMIKVALERFYKNLNKAVAACKVLREAFGEIAKTMKNYDEFCKAISEAYKIEEHKKIKG